MILAYLLAATHPKGRLTGWRWKIIARYVRRRDRNRCQLCGWKNKARLKSQDPRRMDVHHRTWVSQGGTNWPWNLVTYCKPCHEHIHGRQF